MSTRGRKTGTIAVVTGGWVEICDIQVGGSEGVHCFFANPGVESVSAVRFLVSYDDGVSFVPYPYATQRDVNVLIDLLIATTGGATVLMPSPEEGILRVEMQVAAGTGSITFETVPVDGGRLGTGITIDGIDYGTERDVGSAFHGQMDVDNTGVQRITIPPECESFTLQNCSLVPIHIKFNDNFAIELGNGIVLGACDEDPFNPGVPLLGTGGYTTESSFRGYVGVYDPLNTSADLRYVLVGVTPV